MRSTTSIPAEILQFKPCNSTRIRNDNGIFRVYKYKSVKLPSGKWSNDYGYLIGKIIPGVGFISNKRYQKDLEEAERTKKKEIQKQQLDSDQITDLAYGQYGLLHFLADDIFQKLKACFPEEKAAQIYSLALILCAEGFTHMDQINDIYEVSFLSWLFHHYDFKMGSTALSNLLKELGMRTNPIRLFEQSLIDTSSKNIAIDGHVIRSSSEENGLAETGYKLRQLGSTQINLLIAYDTINDAPLMYKSFRGSSVDKSSAKNFIESRSFKNTKFVVDGGFYSKTILDLMSKDGNTYIIPVHTNHVEFKKMKDNLTFSSGEFIYSSGKKETARIVYQEKVLPEGKRLLVFKDMDENNSKRKSYKRNMDLEETGYTQEGYDKYCEWWGVYVFETNSLEPADAIFRSYKKRWGIETYNNYIKNYADFNDLKMQDYYHAQGFDFIMLVTGLIHTRLNTAVRNLNKTNLSTFDILLKARKLRMVCTDDCWQIQNKRTKDMLIFEQMGFKPELTLPLKSSYVQKAQ